ncbi:MAG: ectoine synthase [Alphaproteobacteria bacterium]
MIVKRLDDLLGTPAEVKAETWTSRRFLLRRDGVGFSMHDTVLNAGTETHMWYANHIEAVYVISGEGELEDKTDGRVYPLAPGTLYALDGHEKHVVRAHSDLRTVCVFNPPVTGQEVHDADGVYPLIEDAAE